MLYSSTKTTFTSQDHNFHICNWLQAFYFVNSIEKMLRSKNVAWIFEWKLWKKEKEVIITDQNATISHIFLWSLKTPFKKKKALEVVEFEKVVLHARRSAAERNKIAHRFKEERNKIARSFGGERNKIAHRYRQKRVSWLGVVLVTE